MVKFLNCSMEHYFARRCIRSCMFSVTWSNDRRPRWRTDVCFVELLPIKFSFISVERSRVPKCPAESMNVSVIQRTYLFISSRSVKKGKEKPRQFSIGSSQALLGHRRVVFKLRICYLHWCSLISEISFLLVPVISKYFTFPR